MVTKVDTITAHVMALSAQTIGKFFSVDDPGDMKTLERWQMRLSNLPDDPKYIDSLFEPFYAQKFMPQPADLMKEHWLKTDPNMLSGYETGRATKQLTWKELAKAPKSNYGKAICELIYRRFGVPSEEKDGSGRTTKVVTKHENPINTQQEYMDELKALSKKHSVPWQGME